MRGNWRMWKNTKAVIFDLDGTLADSMWIWKEIDIRFLAQRHLPMPEGLQREIEGLSMRETAVYFRERFGLRDTEEELMGEWNDMAYRAYVSEVPWKPGAEEFLTQLRHEGIAMGIATSNSPELVKAFLLARGKETFFDCVVTANEVSRGKPAPDVYLKAKEGIGAASEECLVFEDILPGIAAGHNAGMKVCAVYDDYTKDIDEEKRSAADFYIRDYYDLMRGGKIWKDFCR